MFNRFNLWVGELVSRTQSLKAREDGQALVEYALILALISVGAITVLTLVGTDVVAKLQAVANALVPPAP
jgi:pilus assembly protein Flp/PilA